LYARIVDCLISWTLRSLTGFVDYDMIRWYIRARNILKTIGFGLHFTNNVMAHDVM